MMTGPDMRNVAAAILMASGPALAAWGISGSMRVAAVVGGLFLFAATALLLIDVESRR